MTLHLLVALLLASIFLSLATPCVCDYSFFTVLIFYVCWTHDIEYTQCWMLLCLSIALCLSSPFSKLSYHILASLFNKSKRFLLVRTCHFVDWLLVKNMKNVCTSQKQISMSIPTPPHKRESLCKYLLITFNIDQ